MNHKHGSLESIILNALWGLEGSGMYKNSVKDVYDFINASSLTNRAYTTIKTVMDRMFEKELLLRIKQGKKFFYRTNYSCIDVIRGSLEKIAKQYCNSDMTRLLAYAHSICQQSESQKLWQEQMDIPDEPVRSDAFAEASLVEQGALS